MWLASILTSGAASLGRVLIVGLLPNAIVVVFIWMLVQSGGFSGQSNWDRLIPPDLKADLLIVLLVALGVTLMTVVLQPFQIRMIRLLEGYWQRWWLTARLAPVFVEIQERRLERMRKRASQLGKILGDSPTSHGTLTEQIRQRRLRGKHIAERDRLRARIARYPKSLGNKQGPIADERRERTELLPTALGNALRVAETSAGERYGLDTLSSWPRIYPLFSDKFSAVQASARDSLDAAVNLCVSFTLVAILAAVALVDEPKAYWIPVTAGLLAFVSYLGAIAAAVDYGGLVLVAFDLHRFDLVKALHHKLPDDTTDEFEYFRKLSQFFLAEKGTGDLFQLAARQHLPHKYDHKHEKEETKEKGS